MDSHPSVAASLTESCVPLSFSSEPSPPGASIDPLVPPANSAETLSAEFMGGGENTEDGVQENQRKRRPFRGRSRSQFRGWYGKRWGVGFQAKFHHHPFLVDTGAIYCQGSDNQHGNGSFRQQVVAPQVVPRMNHSTTGGESIALDKLPATKASLPPQASVLPLAWCGICRVDCNSLKVLEKHMIGKRHKRTVQLLEKMEGRLEMVQEEMKPEQYGESVAVPIEEVKAKGSMETSNINCDTSANPKKKRKRNSAPEQPRVCVLCNSVCNSLAMFESHLAGKKHASRLRHFQSPNIIYGLMNDYIPPNQSSSSASQDAQPLYYGLMNCEQPQAYAVLNPHLEQAYDERKEQDSEGQYGFIVS